MEFFEKLRGSFVRPALRLASQLGDSAELAWWDAEQDLLARDPHTWLYGSNARVVNMSGGRLPAPKTTPAAAARAYRRRFAQICHNHPRR